MCAFVSQDIKKGEIIWEYEGEVISLQEADRRKKLYETMGSPFQLMAIESAGHNVAQVFLKELNNNNIYLYQKRKIR